MFAIYKDKSKKFRFRLKAKNGEIICASQAYTTKSACTKGAKSLIVNFSFLILSAYPINILDRAYFLKKISESVDMDKAQV